MKDVLGWISVVLGVVAIPATAFVLWGALAGLAGAGVGIVAIRRRSSRTAGIVGVILSGVAVVLGLIGLAGTLLLSALLSDAT